MSEELARYLRDIASQLDVDPSREEEILGEIRNHLQEAVANLEEHGRSREESVALALERFGEAREVGRMLNRVHGDPPWLSVGLAILPGLFALAGGAGLFHAAWGINMGETVGRTGLLGVCVLVVTAGWAKERRLAVWSYPAWGVLLYGVWLWVSWAPTDQASPFWQVAPPLLMLAVIGAYAGYSAYRARGIRIPTLAWALLALTILSVVASLVPSIVSDQNSHWGFAILAMLPLSLWWMGLLLMPVVIGLPFARREGLPAGLIVVAAAYVLVEGILDPAYGILIWTSNSATARTLSCLPSLAFLVAPPIWVLGCRGARGRTWGLVLPSLISLVSAAIVRGAALQGTAIAYGADSWLRDFLSAAQFVLLLALTAVVYRWIGPRGSAGVEDMDCRTAGSQSLGYAADEQRA
jgi:hypothetical protein